MREYGQGSYSQKKAKRDSNNRSFKKVVSYYFDNSLSKITAYKKQIKFNNKLEIK